MMVTRWMSSPLGRILLRAEDEYLTGLFFENQKHFPDLIDESPGLIKSSCLDLAEEQVAEYFAGKRIEFELPCWLNGTDFQVRVWKLLRSIDCGSTRSYGELATDLGCTDSARAVGAAVGRNPISLIYPCHRVVGKAGEITGYAGGIDRKRWLLHHELEMANAGGHWPGLS